jgi:hypothetical protein
VVVPSIGDGVIHSRVSAPATCAPISLQTDTLLGGDCIADFLYLHPATFQVLGSVSILAVVSWRGA